MRKIIYINNCIKWFVVRVYNHFARPQRWEFKGKKYAGKKKLSVLDGINKIEELIENGTPFMVARFGSNELEAMTQGYAIDLGIRKTFSKRCIDYMRVLAGFFPSNEQELKKFSILMQDSLKYVDLIGVWYNPNEDYFIKYCMPNAEVTPIAAINELHKNKSWMSPLRGKRIVVVSPFKDTILHQYSRRELLFSNPNYLPKFELRVVKAIQTAANERNDRFEDWFEALQYMYDEVMSEEFDIALLGCGAYGFPLAAKIKAAGKSAIHVGGGLQLLFGIKGGKWDGTGTEDFYNDFWVRPSINETPKDYKKVEDGCYW